MEYTWTGTIPAQEAFLQVPPVSLRSSSPKLRRSEGLSKKHYGLTQTLTQIAENRRGAERNNLRVLGYFRSQKAWKPLYRSGRRNRRQLITRRSLVQVQPPQPQNCLISQEIRQFFFTFYPKKFPEKLCDFAKFAVDPNRDPDGSKIRPGGGVSASGSSCFLEEIFRSLQRRRQNLLHGPGRFLLGRRGDVCVGVQREAC